MEKNEVAEGNTEQKPLPQAIKKPREKKRKEKKRKERKSNPMPKYQSSHLTIKKSIKIRARLIHVCTTESIYQNNKLSLPLLAQQLQTNTKYLSQVINQHYHQNFTTFINTHRIQAFQQKLLDGQAQKLTLFGLAQECGFHNRSTFYRAFRNHTGQSPKQFLQEQQ